MKMKSILFLAGVGARLVSNQFFGVVYSPYRNGACPTAQEVRQDISLVGLMTQRIHLYGMDCNQTQMVLEAMEEQVPQATTMLGMWVRGEGRFEKELSVLDNVLSQRRHHGRIEGICVGNEELFAKSATAAQLIVMLDKVRRLVAQHGLYVPVFTTDVPGLWTPELAAASDAILANIHPYFDHGSANPAKSAALRVMQQYDALSLRFSNLNKPVVIGETGWPSAGAALRTSGPASLQAQEEFLHSIVCQCHAREIPYYLFEAIDSPWKPLNAFGDAERHFGLATDKRSPRYLPQQLLSC